MGSGKSKSHEAFGISPSSATTAAVIGDDASVLDPVDVDLGPELVAQVDHMLKLAANSDPGDLEEFIAIKESLAEASDSATAHQAINAAEVAFCSLATTEELTAIAEHQGVDPAVAQTLAVVDSESGALASYIFNEGVDEASQIALIGEEVLQELANGNQINGMKLSDVVDATLMASAPEFLDGDETWEGTPEEFLAAVAELNDIKSHPDQHDWISAENRVMGFTNPEMDQKLIATTKLQARITNPPITGIETHLQTKPDALSAVELACLEDDQQLRLLRMSTPTPARLKLKAEAAVNAEAKNQINALLESGAADVEALAAHGLSGFSSWAAQTKQFLALTNVVKFKMWAKSVAPDFWGGKHSAARATLAKDFRSWAKKQPLTELRKTAITAGLADQLAQKASRAALQNWLLSEVSPTIQNKQEIIDKLTPKKPAPSATASTGPPPSSKSAKVGPSMSATPVLGKSGFVAGVKALGQKLRALKAASVDVPEPTPGGVVTAHNWGKGSSFSAGSHESWTFKGPGGSKWMFKPDKSANGARAEAEAAASRVFAAAGVATVDVHVVDLKGKTGAIQPLVAGCGHLSAKPSTFTQSDVDQIVALHVAAWTVGDHDGHSGNVLRTPSGAVLGVDHGQAFKFMGQDKLAAGWKPSSNPSPAIYDVVYKASSSGGLGDGIKVRAAAALPVINKLEAISDSDYRSMLSETAHQGAANGVHWVSAMRKQAQTNLGKSSVTNAEIANEFLNAAVARKNNLRSDFAAFFGGLGLADATHLEMGL